MSLIGRIRREARLAVEMEKIAQEIEQRERNANRKRTVVVVVSNESEEDRAARWKTEQDELQRQANEYGGF